MGGEVSAIGSAWAGFGWSTRVAEAHRTRADLAVRAEVAWSRRSSESCSVGEVAVGSRRPNLELPKWKHRWISELASRAVGVDILADEVAELCRKGFDVRCVDATSEVDLGERFSRVFMGDVIEHVDNPVALLRFARRHLAPGGRILCTTPNPYFVTYIVDALRSGAFIPNAEHVTWITPTMALELAHRAGLRLSEYWHVQGEGKTMGRKLGVKVLSALNLRDSEVFSGSFCYLFEAGSPD